MAVLCHWKGTNGLSAGRRRIRAENIAAFIENTGDTDLVFLEMFKSDRYQEFSFSEWLAHTPPKLVMAHLHIDNATLAAIPKRGAVVTPLS